MSFRAQHCVPTGRGGERVGGFTTDIESLRDVWSRRLGFYQHIVP